MNAIPCLTIQDVANLDGVLGEFLKKAEAELTVVIDRGGNVISQFGDMTVMDVTIIAALAADHSRRRRSWRGESARSSSTRSITRETATTFS